MRCMEILRHHARGLEREYGYSGGDLKKLEGRLKNQAADMPLICIGNQQAYPHLGSIEVRKEFVIAQMDALRAMLNGMAKIIPEQNPHGSYNKDGICDACGNFGPANRCLHFDWSLSEHVE